MQQIELATLITELCGFYERKEPKQNTIELWFKLVKNIPSESLNWVTKKIFETHESFPRNITASLWAAFTEWQQANPDKRAIQSYFSCTDCSEGLIFARSKKTGNEYVFRCAKCRQDHTKAYPVSSRLELLENYEVVL